MTVFCKKPKKYLLNKILFNLKFSYGAKLAK